MGEIERARKVFEIEAKEIAKLAERVNESFVSAIDLVSKCRGKVVCTGIGKSGHVARKIAATMSSTGTPALFLHPAESSHGDMGAISKDDVVVAISYSGETLELADVLKYIARRGIPLISMTGVSTSTLAKAADVVLDIKVDEEACPMGLAPTASSAATMAMGDALAMVLIDRRGFQPEDFAEFHPGGSLGRRLLTRVRDLMHPKDKGLVVTKKDTLIKDLIFLMTTQEVNGIAGIVSDKGELIGVVTDGDLRRKLGSTENLLLEKAGDLMGVKPKVVDLNEMAERALFYMEEHSISALFVVDQNSDTPEVPIGILHLQDLLASGIR